MQFKNVTWICCKTNRSSGGKIPRSQNGNFASIVTETQKLYHPDTVFCNFCLRAVIGFGRLHVNSMKYVHKKVKADCGGDGRRIAAMQMSNKLLILCVSHLCALCDEIRVIKPLMQWSHHRTNVRKTSFSSFNRTDILRHSSTVAATNCILSIHQL